MKMPAQIKAGAQGPIMGGTDMMRSVSSTPLWKRVGELGASSAFLLYLSDVASDRLSLTQAAFFMLAATADAAGKPATRTQLIHAYGDNFGGSVRNTYRQLLEPSRVFPKALGWLTTEENPDDSREQFLRLTNKGKAVIDGALLALEPITMPNKRRTQ
jgi:hypothetical protein